MSEQPKTGRELSMKLDMESNRIERRDSALALAIGAEMADKYFDPLAIEDMRDVRKLIIAAAEHAAYQAIQKERELHLGDMAALRKWSEVKWAEAISTPPRMVVTNPPEAPR